MKAHERNLNKKFQEKLITYSPLIRHGLHGGQKLFGHKGKAISYDF
jgi:hypothetical protein